MSDNRARQGSVEIEITEEMVEAGAAAFSAYDPDFDNSESMAIEIFRAMISASRAAKSASVVAL